MKEEQLPAEETLTLLGENARRLRLLTDGIPVDRLHMAPEPMPGQQTRSGRISALAVMSGGATSRRSSRRTDL